MLAPDLAGFGRTLAAGRGTDVESNRRLLAAHAGYDPAQLVATRHVHGVNVWRVGEPLGPDAEFDGLVCDRPGPVLGAFAADCIDWRGTDGLTVYQEEILGGLPQRKRTAVRGPHGLRTRQKFPVRDRRPDFLTQP